MDEPLVVNDGGNLHTQIWHYPSRTECLTCHTIPAAGGLALGFNTPQLNRDFDYGGVIDNQLRAFSNASYFSAPVTNLNSLRALAPSTNEAASVECRVRSYLTANCSGCHVPSGPGLSTFDVRIITPLSATRLINGSLTNTTGNPLNRVIVPGSLTNSMLLTRISTLGAGRMPPTGSTELDAGAISLVSRWITNDLPSYHCFAEWQLLLFGETNSPLAMAAADPDTDGANNQLEWLTGTSPLLVNDVSPGLSVGLAGSSVLFTYPRVANRGFDLQSTTDFAGNTWQSLDVIENRPFFSASNTVVTVPDLMTNAAVKFYRLRVYEP